MIKPDNQKQTKEMLQKGRDTYESKLGFAKSLGYENLSDAFGHYGREEFEKHFAESLNPKKHK